MAAKLVVAGKLDKKSHAAKIARAIWRAVDPDVKVALLAFGLRDCGDMTLGQLAALTPPAKPKAEREGMH